MKLESEKTDIANSRSLELRQASFPARLRSDALVLFFHGVSHGANFYDLWSRKLAHDDGIMSAAVSFEGHGLSPLKETRKSINDLRISDYKNNILDALKHFSVISKDIICTGHSMGGRVLYELFHEGRLPEAVKGVVLLNPVPPSGILCSAISATFGDMLRSGRPTPLTFPYSLFIKKDLQDFLKSDPQRTLSVFFSSDSPEQSRIVNMNATDFCENYLFPESNKVVNEILLPSKTAPTKQNIPMLLVGSKNDRIISCKDILKISKIHEQAGYYATSTQLFSELSHESPMDIDNNIVIESIISWLRNNSLLS